MGFVADEERIGVDRSVVLRSAALVPQLTASVSFVDPRCPRLRAALLYGWEQVTGLYHSLTTRS